MEREPAEVEQLRSRLAPKFRYKFWLDRVVSVPFLPVLALTTVGVALLMAVEGWSEPRSRGPVFYSEERWTAGRSFQIFKYRTSFPGTQAAGTVGEVTRTGLFLKKYYFDELPQLFNIACGDMTLVGPRPTVPSRARQEIEGDALQAIFASRA